MAGLYDDIEAMLSMDMLPQTERPGIMQNMNNWQPRLAPISVDLDRIFSRPVNRSPLRMPTRDEYQRPFGQRLASAIVGSGLAAKNPEAGLRFAENFNDKPYVQAMDDFNRQSAMQHQEALLSNAQAESRARIEMQLADINTARERINNLYYKNETDAWAKDAKLTHDYYNTDTVAGTEQDKINQLYYYTDSRSKTEHDKIRSNEGISAADRGLRRDELSSLNADREVKNRLTGEGLQLQGLGRAEDERHNKALEDLEGQKINKPKPVQQLEINRAIRRAVTEAARKHPQMFTTTRNSDGSVNYALAQPKPAKTGGVFSKAEPGVKASDVDNIKKEIMDLTRKYLTLTPNNVGETDLDITGFGDTINAPDEED